MITINTSLHNILTLAVAFGAGSRKAVEVYRRLSDCGNLDLPIQKAIEVSDLDDTVKARILGVKDARISGIIDKCNENKIDIIPIYDNRYPECLRNIAEPPLILFVKGAFPDFESEPVFCIVGPRKITDFGKKAAYSLARRLARAGMIIVGGAAKGGDYATHSGTLSAGGKCVMVAADGIVTQMNSKYHQLCKDILEKGCIISESPPDYVARRYNFPIRNRIMAGLSLGVAVIEAPEISGTLITASHAADQGKDVFVVPGNPVDKEHKGSNALLRDGAIPLLDASDIFCRYIADFPEKINIENAYKDQNSKKLKKNSQKNSIANLSKEAQLVYNSLDKSEFMIDDLSGLGIDSGTILSAVTELEFEHLIKSLPGGTYKISD